MSKFSFIIPHRGHFNSLEVVIGNIITMFPNIDKEIIVVTQMDNTTFKKGQLYNIGFTYSTGDYIILMDNDILTIHPLDIEKTYKSFNSPYLAFTHISQVSLHKNRKDYTITSTEERPAGFGAFLVVSRDDFLKVNGFSNLYVGWGWEDAAFCSRLGNVPRLQQDLGHITHPRRINSHVKNTNLNHEFYLTEHTRDNKLDGLAQTRYELISAEQSAFIHMVSVSNITTSHNYKYAELLNRHFA